MQKYLHSPSGTQPHVDGDWYYVPHVNAEIARLKAEADLLKAALRWCCDNNHYICPDGVIGPVAIDPEIEAVIAEAVGSKT